MLRPAVQAGEPDPSGPRSSATCLGRLWILVGATLGGGVHDAVVLFASMFEALFILLGDVWNLLGDTCSWLGEVTATGLLFAAWGFFLHQGLIDPRFRVPGEMAIDIGHALLRFE